MEDPYLSDDVAFERLWNEYEKYGKIIVATDWDDTLNDYHKKGYTYTKVINLLRECQDLGFYLCVFTGTPKEKWDGIREYCGAIGLNVSTINENVFPMPFGNDGKIYFNILLDDRAGLSASYAILRKVVDKAKENKKTD